MISQACEVTPYICAACDWTWPLIHGQLQRPKCTRLAHPPEKGLMGRIICALLVALDKLLGSLINQGDQFGVINK